MVTNKQAVDLLSFMNSERFNSFKFTLPGHRKVQKNLKVLNSLLEELKAVEAKYLKPSEELLEVEEAKKSLLLPFSEVDSDGNAIIDENGVLKLKEGVEETVKTLLKEFLAKNSKVYLERDSSVAEWNKFFHIDKAELELKTLSPADLVLGDEDSLSKIEFEMLSLLVPSLLDDLEDDSEKE